MTERYFITGAQLGTISALIECGKFADVIDMLEEITDKQFIGNIEEPYEDYEIVIRKKNNITFNEFVNLITEYMRIKKKMDGD